MEKINYKNLICPKCGKMFDVWNHKTDNTMFEGECTHCLINIHIELKDMDDEEVRELARR